MFVGNISKNVKISDLETEFQKYGPCKINVPKGSYAFVDYENDKDAEDAMDALKGRSMGGRPITVEWSKQSD